MPNIGELRKNEMQEIIDFYHYIEEYGHIFYGDNSELEDAFKKIMEGIEQIRVIMDDYYSY
jgi:hypothetical protein